jgi:hypothetical protein
LQKSEISATLFSFTASIRFGPALIAAAGGEEEEGKFFIFFPRNPLKRLDSKMQEKANESNSVLVCFCRLLPAFR